MNWCISLHWKQLPRQAAQTGGGRDWRNEGTAGRREPFREREPEAGERTEGELRAAGRKAKRMHGQCRDGQECAQAPGCLRWDWPGIDSWVTLEGSAQGEVAVGSGGGLSLR